MNEKTIRRLHDARNAALKAQHYLGTRSEEEYLADEGLNLIIERLLEIVGEALASVRRHEPALEDGIPDLNVAVSVRIASYMDTITWIMLCCLKRSAYRCPDSSRK